MEQKQYTKIQKSCDVRDLSILVGREADMTSRFIRKLWDLGSNPNITSISDVSQEVKQYLISGSPEGFLLVSCDTYPNKKISCTECNYSVPLNNLRAFSGSRFYCTQKERIVQAKMNMNMS